MIEYLIWILGFAILVFVISAIYYMNKKPKAEKNKDEEEITPDKGIYPYKLNQRIFSPKEGYFYRDVRPIAEKLGLIVFTKMRLADLLEVPKNHPDYMKWFNRIKAKHIDFILVDSSYHIKLLVEVDDPSHNRPDRQARDQEVDEIFRQQGLEVLHLRVWGKQYGADDLETIISNALNVHNVS